MKFLTSLRLLILSIWLGSGVFFIAAAQVAFSVLPDSELAGAVVGRNLLILNYAGLIVSVILLLTSVLGSMTVKTLWLWIERLLLLALAVSCAIGQFVIGYWMLTVRAQIGKPMSELAADDPLRIQFNNLHQYSEWVFMAGMIAALLAFLVIANRRSKTIKVDPADPFDFSKEFKA